MYGTNWINKIIFLHIIIIIIKYNLGNIEKFIYNCLNYS